jgi:hypothetical protein
LKAAKGYPSGSILFVFLIERKTPEKAANIFSLALSNSASASKGTSSASCDQRSAISERRQASTAMRQRTGIGEKFNGVAYRMPICGAGVDWVSPSMPS